MSWPMVKLGDVAPSRPLKNPKIENTERIWQLNLDMVEANSGQIIERIYQPLDEAGTSTHWFDANHVLYSKLRPYLNKVVTPDEQGLATTELVPLLPDPKRLDRNFLAYYLRSSEFVRWISEQVAGAKMPRVSMDLFWNHEIPLPPLAEQKRIAAILDKADAIRRKRQQAIQLADDFLRAVFLEMFGEFVTPVGYEKAPKFKIKELVEYIDYRGKTPEKSDSGVTLITAKNVKKGFIDEDPREYIPAENYESWMTRGLPKENDVLFTTEAPLGNVALLGKYDKVVVGQRLIALRSKGQLTHEYLMCLLLHPFIQGLIQNKSSGSTVTGIRTKELYEIELPVPDKQLQNQFTNTYWKVDSFKKKIYGSLSGTNETFMSLSQKAFSGQL